MVFLEALLLGEQKLAYILFGRAERLRARALGLNAGSAVFTACVQLLHPQDEGTTLLSKSWLLGGGNELIRTYLRTMPGTEEVFINLIEHLFLPLSSV